MRTLDDLLASRPSLDLDELTEATNDLLPEHLPDDPVDSRVSDTVNPRLIRHYVSEGTLDSAMREGRKAVYSVDHVLQLLALRRLLAEGISSSTIGSSLTYLDRPTLRAIAEGRAGTEALSYSLSSERNDPANRRARAAATLSEIRARVGDPRSLSDARSRSATPPASSPPRASRPPDAESPPPDASGPSRSEVDASLSFSAYRLQASPPSASESADAPSRWERVPLLDGVELHVRNDVRLPDSVAAREKLLDGVELHVRNDVRLPDSVAAREKLLDHVIREIVLYAQRRDS